MPWQYPTCRKRGQQDNTGTWHRAIPMFGNSMNADCSIRFTHLLRATCTPSGVHGCRVTAPVHHMPKRSCKHRKVSLPRLTNTNIRTFWTVQSTLPAPKRHRDPPPTSISCREYALSTRNSACWPCSKPNSGCSGKVRWMSREITSSTSSWPTLQQGQQLSRHFSARATASKSNQQGQDELMLVASLYPLPKVKAGRLLRPSCLTIQMLWSEQSQGKRA